MKDADVSSDYRVYIAGPILTNTLFYTDNNLYENIWKTLSDSKTEKSAWFSENFGCYCGRELGSDYFGI